MPGLAIGKLLLLLIGLLAAALLCFLLILWLMGRIADRAAAKKRDK